VETVLNKFVIVREKTNGDVIITEDTQYNHIVADSVIIEENVTARLFGEINTLILKKGSCLYMHGTILGKVINYEGDLHKF